MIKTRDRVAATALQTKGREGPRQVHHPLLLRLEGPSACRSPPRHCRRQPGLRTADCVFRLGAGRAACTAPRAGEGVRRDGQGPHCQYRASRAQVRLLQLRPKPGAPLPQVGSEQALLPGNCLRLRMRKPARGYGST